MGTQIQNSLPWTLKGMLARIMVALLLVLLALPVFYHGILGMYALFWNGFTFEPTLVLLALVPVLVVLNAVGTLLSFRHALILAGCAGRVLSGLGFHHISNPRSFAEFVHTLVLGNYVCHSMPESGMDSLVAPRASRVEVGGVTGR